MRKLLNTAIFTTLATVNFSGQAAESATLAVTGTITPSTCNVSASAASIDLGVIAPSTLINNTNIIMGNDVTLNVSCTAPTVTAVQLTDNRTSSAMTVAEATEAMRLTNTGYNDDNFFGLGTDSAAAKIGTLALAVNAATADGKANSGIITSTDKENWNGAALSESSPQGLTKNNYISQSATFGLNIPSAMTESTYNIVSQIMLKKSSMYPAGEDVNIDGNVTFSVVYL